MKACFNGKRAQAFECKNYNVCQASDMLPAKLNQLPAFLLGRTAKQTAQCQTVGDRLRKFVSFFNIPIGYGENLFWTWRIKYLPISVTWQHVKRKVLGISKKALILWRIDDQGTFWPIVIRIRHALLIDHFTVVCSVTWPLNASEAEVDLALMQSSLSFLIQIPTS